MKPFLTSIHVLNCIVLIIVVLLQAGKGAGMAGVFGASSATGQQIFGGRGAGGFLGRLTAILAIVFMFTSIVLTLIGGDQTQPRSVVSEQAREMPVGPAGTGTPGAPGATAPGTVPGLTTPAGEAGTDAGAATPSAGDASPSSETGDGG